MHRCSQGEDSGRDQDTESGCHSIKPATIMCFCSLAIISQSVSTGVIHPTLSLSLSHTGVGGSRNREMIWGKIAWGGRSSLPAHRCCAVLPFATTERDLVSEGGSDGEVMGRFLAFSCLDTRYLQLLLCLNTAGHPQRACAVSAGRVSCLHHSPAHMVWILEHLWLGGCSGQR